jgi:hypothetical protein
MEMVLNLGTKIEISFLLVDTKNSKHNILIYLYLKKK